MILYIFVQVSPVEHTSQSLGSQLHKQSRDSKIQIITNDLSTFEHLDRRQYQGHTEEQK